MTYDLLLERFLRYVKINTRSDENATKNANNTKSSRFCLESSKTRIRRNWVCPISIIWKVMDT